jgi:RNA polymerase sigma factor (sigma-70 family)
MKTCAKEDLLERLRQGDPASLEELYALTRDRLFTVLRRLGADAATAEDLAHEVYVRLWTHRERLPAVGSTVGYLCAMARNLWINHREHRGFLRRLQDRLRLRARPVRSSASVTREDIDRALAALDEEPREVFTLHRYGGLSHREIAELQGVSVKTVEARMKRAFDELRACFRPERKNP